jgi:hypothetical protein
VTLRRRVGTGTHDLRGKRQPSMNRRCAIWLTAVLFGAGGAPEAQAQLMEPLSYTNAPIGLNFLIAGYSHQWGSVLADPTAPVRDVSARVDAGNLAYSRIMDFWGQSGSVAVVLPYAWLDASGEVFGQSRSVGRAGLADMTLRLAINLLGAPALSLQEFAKYRQDTIVGVTLVMTAPTGQYDSGRLINIGTNRWSFKPEIGVSQALGAWTLEAAAGVTLFTDNDAFAGDNTRAQAPLYSVQAHAIYTFNPRLWAALDGTFYSGGRTTLNGVQGDDLQSNSRWGGTLAWSLNRHQSIKGYFSSGVAARTGTDFNVVGLAWQLRWGAGL